MRRVAAAARWALLVALALLAASEPLRAQQPPPEARANGASGQAARARRFQQQPRVAPPIGFERWTHELSPSERRALRRNLTRLPETRQREFFQRWEGLTYAERRELAAELRARRERRAERQLPERLRTPEVRQRIGQMSPEERERFFQRARKWRELDRAERQQMRGRLERFALLSEAEQRALVDHRFARKGADERALILEQLRAAAAQHTARKAKRGEAAPAPQAAPSDAAP